MTYANDRREDYVNQGQQDDYFDRDLAIAGREPKPPVAQDIDALDEYTNQGQQDDHFEEDLTNSARSQTSE